MELQIWRGDWGLPSVDHRCLAVMAYCKFSEAPVSFVKANNPWKSPSGEFPVLKHERGAEADVTEIFDFLRKNNWGLDQHLSTKQCADIVAFSAMMEEKLVPALAHLWWVDAKTYVEFTRPWYTKALAFPLNLYFPIKKHKDCANQLEARGFQHMSDTERETQIYKDAKECMNMLSVKLGERDFFFGSSPSSLDALVFGFLAPLLKAPVPSSSLPSHLKGCANLCQMCQRVLNKHFPLSAEEQEELRKREEETRKKQVESVEFPNKRRNMMIAGAVALSAMVGYAFMSGLIQVEVVDDNKDTLIPDPTKPPIFTPFDNMFEEEETGGSEDKNHTSNGQEHNEDEANSNTA